MNRLHRVALLLAGLTLWQVEMCVAIGMATARRNSPAPVTPSGECCVECRGTGTVLTGDGRSLPCGCPPSCKCKQPKSEPSVKSVLVNPPQPCLIESCPPPTTIRIR